MEESDFDVIVVGGGVGGCAAADEAAALGARVALIEAGPEIGGNAARSTGYLAFAGTQMQRDAGIEDSPEIFLEDIEREIARQQIKFPIQYNREIARRFAEESGETYDYLHSLGLRWDRFVRRPTLHTIDRMCHTVDVSKFRTGFEKRLADRGVRIIKHARVCELLTTGKRVTSVRVREQNTDGTLTEREISAERGVILATGGYQANATLRERFQVKALSEAPFLGIDTVRGDGHVMAAALGGDLVTMSMIPLFVVAPGALLEDCIAVNLEGERYHDENGPYDSRVVAVQSQPEETGFYIFDSESARIKGAYIREFPAEVVQADSLEELAAHLGCDPVGVADTVDRWNKSCQAGADDAFGRVVFPADRRGLTSPPYYATRVVVGISFPSGGIRVTRDMEVVDLMGRTIPGLFAVGDCAGGVSSAVSLGGLRITPAVTLGRVAGREIMAVDVTEPPRQVHESLLEGKVVTRSDNETVMMLHD